MTTTWPFTVAAIAAAGYALRGRGKGGSAPARTDLDIAKSGQILALAADWLRADDIHSAATLLDLVPDSVWDFARDEVVAVADEPRIAQLADRMSAVALLTPPPDTSATADRLLQVEALHLIAKAIRIRMHPTR